MATVSKPYRHKSGSLASDYKMNGKRQTWYFSKDASVQDAESFRVFLQELLNSRILGIDPNAHCCERIAALAPEIVRKLVDRGFLSSRFLPVTLPTLGELCADYMKVYENAQGEKAEKTLANNRQGVAKLLAFFSPNVRIDEITPAKAQDFRRWLLCAKEQGGAGLAPSTVSGYIKVAKRVFKRAVDLKLLPETPFKEVKAGKQNNKGRKRYLPLDRFFRVLHKIPELGSRWAEQIKAELRLALAFGRLAGVRLPHEIKNLKFSDMEVPSPIPGCASSLGFQIADKTKTGGRWVPMIPDFRREWELYCSTLEKKTEYVFPELHKKSKSWLYGRLQRALADMNEEDWPVLLHTLRTSWINDMEEKGVGSASLSDWVGNSEEVRRQHYELAHPADLAKIVGDFAASFQKSSVFTTVDASFGAGSFDDPFGAMLSTLSGQIAQKMGNMSSLALDYVGGLEKIFEGLSRCVSLSCDDKKELEKTFGEEIEAMKKVSEALDVCAYLNEMSDEIIDKICEKVPPRGVNSLEKIPTKNL